MESASLEGFESLADVELWDMGERWPWKCWGVFGFRGLFQPQLFCSSVCFLHELIFFLLNWIKFMAALGQNVQLFYFIREQFSSSQD